MERIVRGSLAQAVVGKVVCDSLGLAARLCHALGRGLDDFADAALMVEHDGARRYKNLTGSDLGFLTGQEDRYSGGEPGYVPEELTFVDEDDAE